MTHPDDTAPSCAEAPLVSADWLAGRIGDPDLVILDASIMRETGADGRGTYRSGAAHFRQEGHVPGARFADLFDDFSDPAARFPFTRPDTSRLDATARKLGLHANSRIVVYDALTGAWAARVWWILRVHGHRHVAVLDGGLAEWCRQGAPLEYGAPADPGTGTWVAAAALRQGFASLAEMVDIVEGRRAASVVCALSEADFSGAGSTDPRRGHIPGSRNLPYRSLLDRHGRFDPASIRRKVARLDLKRDEDIVLYCGGGINAAGLALALEQDGFQRLSIFDGSLAEWRADPALPLETGEDPATAP
ncbi:sulfurtransferase [Gluconacetobacter sp. Hr-1-5]|uniref:sulfurtransferase n=1 Tax=Gluconacetobacter sp. Hr-1-5 TaxID=3395370 RepID=UPI003B523773